jgi:hypothetical protein
MKLTLTVSQDVSNKTFSESYVIELENMKHNPELQIMERIQHLKMIVIKQCDGYVSQLINEETSGELFKRIVKNDTKI